MFTFLILITVAGLAILIYGIATAKDLPDDGHGN